MEVPNSTQVSELPTLPQSQLPLHQERIDNGEDHLEQPLDWDGDDNDDNVDNYYNDDNDDNDEAITNGNGGENGDHETMPDDVSDDISNAASNDDESDTVNPNSDENDSQQMINGNGNHTTNSNHENTSMEDGRGHGTNNEQLNGHRQNRQNRQRNYTNNTSKNDNTDNTVHYTRPGRRKGAALQELFYGGSVYLLCVLLPSLPRFIYSLYLLGIVLVEIFLEKLIGWLRFLSRGVWVLWHGFLFLMMSLARLVGISNDGSDGTFHSGNRNGMHDDTDEEPKGKLKYFLHKASQILRSSTSTSSLLWEEFNHKESFDSSSSTSSPSSHSSSSNTPSFVWGFGRTNVTNPSLYMILTDIQILVGLAVFLAFVRMWLVHVLVPEYLVPIGGVDGGGGLDELQQQVGNDRQQVKSYENDVNDENDANDANDPSGAQDQRDDESQGGDTGVKVPQLKQILGGPSGQGGQQEGRQLETIATGTHPTKVPLRHDGRYEVLHALTRCKSSHLLSSSSYKFGDGIERFGGLLRKDSERDGKREGKNEKGMRASASFSKLQFEEEDGDEIRGLRGLYFRVKDEVLYYFSGRSKPSNHQKQTPEPQTPKRPSALASHPSSSSLCRSPSFSSFYRTNSIIINSAKYKYLLSNSTNNNNPQQYRNYRKLQREEQQRLFSAPRHATATFRLLYTSLSCLSALYLFRTAEFWPPHLLGTHGPSSHGIVGGHGMDGISDLNNKSEGAHGMGTTRATMSFTATTATTPKRKAHRATQHCWDLSGSVVALGFLDGDYDERNGPLRYFFLAQAAYQLHSLCFHLFSMGLLLLYGGGVSTDTTESAESLDTSGVVRDAGEDGKDSRDEDGGEEGDSGTENVKQTKGATWLSRLSQWFQKPRQKRKQPQSPRFLSMKKSMESYLRPMLEHFVVLALLVGSYLFSGLRRLGAVGIFTLEVSGVFLQLLQVCIYAPEGSWWRQPGVVIFVHRFLTIPMFIYCRFFVLPFVVWYSAAFESQEWLEQIEKLTAPGWGEIIYIFFNGLLFLMFSLNLVLFPRLLFHPHLRHIVKQRKEGL